MRKKLLLCKLLVAFLFLSLVATAQITDLSGTIRDENGAPVPGAVVAIRGEKTATTTNDNGFYTLRVPKGATIIVTHVGFGTREFKVEGSNLDIALLKTAKELEEIVVTALGVKKEKKALSYAVGEIKGSDLTEARSVNVANSLEGKVSGMNVTSTATGASGSSRITLRGNGSISGDNQPLIVVDGIPIDNTSTNFLTGTNNNGVSTVGMWAGTDQGQGISSINPDDIESVTVLKGGTAAALWGSRASNGAILITTKSAKKGGGTQVEVYSNFADENIEFNKFKDYQYQYGAGDLGQAPTSNNTNSQTNSYGAKLDGHPVLQYDSVLRPYSPVTNNLSKFYNTGTSFTNGIALSGSTEKTTYRFSVTDLNYDGVMPGNTLRRDNYAINITSQMSDRLSLLVNAKYITEKNHDRPILSDSPGNANYTIFTMPNSLSVATMKKNEENAQGFEIPFSNNVYVTNPYWATDKFTEDDTKNRIITSVEPRFKITDWLYAKGEFGFDKYNFNSTSIIPTGTAFQVGGGYARNMVDYTQTNTGGMLGVDKNLSDKFSLNAIVGVNQTKFSIVGDNSNDGTNPFNIPFFYNVSNITPANLNTSHTDQESTINSTYGSFDFGFNNYLFLNLTGREDWFSTLTTATGTSKNSIFYPSVGLSYVISDAMRMPDFINYAKVRASWAQVGGSGLSPYQLALTYNLTGANGSAPLAQVNGSTIPNPKLQPYQSLSDEVGIETHMIHNRLTIDLAYYNHNVSNDIVQAQVSPTTGYQNIFLNVGKSANKGIESTIGYRIINNKAFTWEADWNFAYNKSTMLAVDPGAGLNQITLDNPRSQTVNIVDEVGKPVSEIQAVAFQRNPAGQIVYNAQGLPVTATTNKDMGSGISPVTTGISNTFHYKSLTLNILVDAKFGGFLYSGTNALSYRYGLAKGTLPGRDVGTIVGPGVETDLHSPNTVAVPVETYYVNMYNFGEPFVYSSDFIKLRSLTLDYALPVKSFGEHNPFKAITISLVGRNLWVIMKKVPNIDPESTYNAGNAQGLEFAGMPITRTMGLNLNLKF